MTGLLKDIYDFTIVNSGPNSGQGNIGVQYQNTITNGDGYYVNGTSTGSGTSNVNGSDGSPRQNKNTGHPQGGSGGTLTTFSYNGDNLIWLLLQGVGGYPNSVNHGSQAFGTDTDGNAVSPWTVIPTTAGTGGSGGQGGDGDGEKNQEIMVPKERYGFFGIYVLKILNYIIVIKTPTIIFNKIYLIDITICLGLLMTYL